MVINHKINMDLAHPQNTPKVSLMQDDRYSRHIIFSLMENGVAWYPPEDTSAIVRYEKTDGTAGGNYDTLPDGEVAYRFEGNNIDIVLAPQVCAAPGEVKLAVALISGNVRLHTFAITIDVERNPGLSVQSENYYKVTGSVADSGWSPNMFLGTDEDGNVVEKQGAVSDEQIEQAVKDYMAENPVEVTGVVKSVNGIAPDENGNVNVESGTGGTGADGFSPIATVTQTDEGATISITDKSGTTTATIANGKDGAKGDKGDTGATGAQGEPGKDGASGKDGTSATHSWNGTVLTVTSASGTSSADLKGEKGDKGDKGEQGIQGIQGEPGEKGDKGDTGATGSTGTSVTVKSVSESTADGGSNVVTFSDGKTLTVKNGKTGATGKDGADGAPGVDGYSPVRGIDYWTPEDIAAIDADIATELAKRGQLKPEFAQTIEDCTDTAKLYVLPDGYIYAYILTEVETGGYTNQVPISTDTDGSIFNGTGYKEGYRVSSGGEVKTQSRGCCTGFIKVNAGDVIRLKGWNFNTTGTNAINASNASKTNIGQAVNNNNYGIFTAEGGYIDYGKNSYVQESTGVWKWVVPPAASGVEYIRVTGYQADAAVLGSNMIVTVNEPIVEKTTVTEYGWANTGHAFVPADYEDRIVSLEEAVKNLEEQEGQSEQLTRTAVNALPSPKSKQFSITDNPNRKLIWSDGYVWRNVADDNITHTALAYQTVRASDGKVMGGYNVDTVYSAHSITKVLSAVAIIRNVSNLSATVTVTADDCTSTASSFVKAGDVASYETLLHCSLLPSDNHATRAMARTVGYILNPSASDDTAARNAFAAELTSIMAEIGMNGSDVRETAAESGLHATASDLCTLYKYVLENCPEITTIWGKLTYDVTVTGSNPRTWTIDSTTSSSARAIIPEFVGGKTGSSDTKGTYAFVWESVHTGTQYITAFLEFDLSTNSRWSNARQNIDEVYSLELG